MKVKVDFICESGCVLLFWQSMKGKVNPDFLLSPYYSLRQTINSFCFEIKVLCHFFQTTGEFSRIYNIGHFLEIA